jgi:hypothetical protein
MDSVKAFVIDTRLGTREEAAHEQLLASWPVAASQVPQGDFDVVRLARGSIGLCSHFQQVRCAVVSASRIACPWGGIRLLATSCVLC